MKKILVAFFIIWCNCAVLAQNEIPKPAQKESEATANEPVEFERPFNFFASAGASARIGKTYDVAISPVDYSVQFENVYPILTRFSMGLVWNPLPDNSEENKTQYFKRSIVDKAYKATRKHLAIALLVNIFQLSFTSDQVNTSSPIDVGFGLGYRKDKFLIMGTLEFTPTRTPRKYFVESFKDKNKQLILSGAQEPLRTISGDDNSLFTNKIFPSIGLKIAYAFSKSQE
jgi:hypothetical protein